jgi:hypothetical protein
MSTKERFCTCAVVKVGGEPTGNRNWNPDCPVHPWDERLQAQADRAVEWQRRAAAAPQEAREVVSTEERFRPDVTIGASYRPDDMTDGATYALGASSAERIHHSDTGAPWMHGHPSHDARPACVDCGADAWFSRVVAVTDAGRVTFEPVCARHRADPWVWSIP